MFKFHVRQILNAIGINDREASMQNIAKCTNDNNECLSNNNIYHKHTAAVLAMANQRSTDNMNDNNNG